MRHLLIPVLFALAVTACSSGSNEPATGTSPNGNFRLATVTAEFVDMDTPGSLTEYDYDESGRIVTVRQSRLNSSGEPDITRYAYGASGIATRSNDFNTETFTYENGRVSQITSSEFPEDTASYTYDTMGRLIGVVGYAFDGDDDCQITPAPGITPEVPAYQLAYSGDRVTSITGSNGEVFTFEYNAQGLLFRDTRVSECVSNNVTDYTYNPDGRLLRVRSEETFSPVFDPVIETDDITYTNGRVTTITSVYSDPTFGTETTTSTLSYDSRGLVTGLSSVDEEVINGIPTISRFDLTLTYENEVCVGGQTAYPDDAILIALQPESSIVDFLFACTYDRDIF